MEEIRTKDEKPFGNKGSLAIALKGKNLTDTYEAVEKDGGWVGVFVAEKATPKKPRLIKCRVHRSNCDPDNKDTPISVTPNAITNRKVFWPGEEVSLTQSHIDILKNSVEEIRIQIPPESGIYAAKDPVAVAKNYYPAMTAEINPQDNTISMISRTPNYLIEFLEI